MKRTLFLLLLLAVPAFAKKVEINVLAKIAGHVVTDRQVNIDNILEEPARFLRGDAVSKASVEQGLQRVIVQYMVLEESRIFGSEKATNEEIDAELQTFKNKLGSKWKDFLAAYDLSQNELKEKFVQKILVRKALSSRVKSAHNQGQGDAGDVAKSDTETIIAEWLKQLRARYRVQMFQVEGKKG